MLSLPHRPLLVRTALLPDESLSSLLVRLAQQNAYDPPSILEGLCHAGIAVPKAERPGCPQHPAVFDRVAILTQLPLAALHGATAHRFAPLLTPPTVTPAVLDLPGAGAWPLLTRPLATAHLRPETAAQFCPGCLQEAPYHHVLWLPAATAVCLSHQRLLVTHCPTCHQPATIRAVVTARCPACDADLTATPSPAAGLLAGQILAQQAIQAWLMDAPLPASVLACRLPAQPPAVLFRVLSAVVAGLLRRAAQGEEVAPEALEERPRSRRASSATHRLSPSAIACLYGEAFPALLQWPEGFAAFHAAHPFLSLDLGESDKAGSETCGPLYRSWITDLVLRPPPIYAFFHEAWERAYLTAWPTLCPAEAALLLGISSALMTRLIQSGRLATLPASIDETEQEDHVPLDQVLALRRTWKALLSLNEAAHWMGITPHAVIALVEVGLLTAEGRPTPQTDDPWTFRTDAIDLCLDALAQPLFLLPDILTLVTEESLIELPAAAEIVTAIGWTDATLLRMVAERRLCSYRRSAHSLEIPRLLFERADLQARVAVVHAGEDWMTRAELCQLMGVTDATLAAWLHAGWVTPVAHYRWGTSYFDRHVMVAFRALHVRRPEIAPLLGVSTDRVRTWIRQGLLTPLPRPEGDQGVPALFRRHDVEVLRHPRPDASPGAPRLSTQSAAHSEPVLPHNTHYEAK